MPLATGSKCRKYQTGQSGKKRCYSFGDEYRSIVDRYGRIIDRKEKRARR